MFCFLFCFVLVYTLSEDSGPQKVGKVGKQGRKHWKDPECCTVSYLGCWNPLIWCELSLRRMSLFKFQNNTHRKCKMNLKVTSHISRKVVKTTYSLLKKVKSNIFITFRCSSAFILKNWTFSGFYQAVKVWIWVLWRTSLICLQSLKQNISDIIIKDINNYLCFVSFSCEFLCFCWE